MKKKQRNTKILGYSPAAISLWETGKRKPSWPFSEKLEVEFPERTAAQWKRANLTIIKKAIKKLRERAAA